VRAIAQFNLKPLFFTPSRAGTDQGVLMPYRLVGVCVFAFVIIMPYHMWSLTAAALLAAVLTPMVTARMKRP
jgi:hypothetical protein